MPGRERRRKGGGHRRPPLGSTTSTVDILFHIARQAVACIGDTEDPAHPVAHCRIDQAGVGAISPHPSGPLPRPRAIHRPRVPTTSTDPSHDVPRLRRTPRSLGPDPSPEGSHDVRRPRRTPRATGRDYFPEGAAPIPGLIRRSPRTASQRRANLPGALQRPRPIPPWRSKQPSPNGSGSFDRPRTLRPPMGHFDMASRFGTDGQADSAPR